MDAKEAIERLKNYPKDSITGTGKLVLSSEIEVAISALEKQIPKEPIFDSGNRLCGECSEIIKAYESHCPFCGQAIKKE